MGSLVDFALKNRFIVLVFAVLLFVWGIISFRALPVEAYPDVANNYVQIITQWPGRAAEEVEQQVTVPVEIQMNGIPHLAHLRSTSLAGLSSVMLIFDDESTNDWNREKVLERIAQVTLPAGLTPQIGTDWSPVGQIYWYTLTSRNPQYDNMALKSLEDWTLEKQFKSVPGVVDVSSFGGITREYQVQLDPGKLVSYGLTIAQVEQQLQSNNVNAGGSFIEEGQQAINVRAVGLFTNVDDIANTLIKTQSGTALRIRDIATVVQGAKIRLGQIGKAIRRNDGVVVDNPDVVEGILELQKGANSDEVLNGIHAKVEELNGIEAQPASPGHFTKKFPFYEAAQPAIAAHQGLLPPGVKVTPFLDRDDLVHLTTHTVLHNLTEGIILVMIILFLFLGNVRGALIVALTIPFSLLFASICLDLRHIPANLLSLGALDFGMVVDGAVVMVENIVRHMNRKHDEPRTSLDIVREAAHEVQRPVFYAIGIIVTAYLPIFTLQQVEGRLFRPMAWTVAFALLGALVFSMFLAPVLSSFLFKNGAKEWHNPVMNFLTRHYRSAALWAVESRWIVIGATSAGLLLAIILTEGGAIGSEFLPHLDEGAIWVRGTLAPSTGPTEGERVMAEARPILANFPEVKDVVSQVGRPDDGTDVTGFFDTEYFVDLKEKKEWRPVLPSEQGRTDRSNGPRAGEDAPVFSGTSRNPSPTTWRRRSAASRASLP